MPETPPEPSLFKAFRCELTTQAWSVRDEEGAGSESWLGATSDLGWCWQ